MPPIQWVNDMTDDMQNEDLQTTIDAQNDYIAELKAELADVKRRNADLMLRQSVASAETPKEPEPEDSFETIVQEAIDKALSKSKR